MSEYIVPTNSTVSILDSIKPTYTYEHKVLPNYSVRTIKSNGLTFEFYDREDNLNIKNNNPGVYILYTIFENFLLLYVGKSRDVQSRQNQHSKSKDKNIFKHAIIITMANNGFTETDISNLENALYLDFKRRDKIVLLNDKIPSKDKNYLLDEIYVLEWIKCITHISLDYMLGLKKEEYKFNPIEPNNHCYNLIQANLTNLKITKVPSHKNIFIIKNSILAISMNSDGDLKGEFATFLESNKKIIKELDVIVENHRLFMLLETKKILVDDFLKLFDKNMLRHYMMNANGQVLKLKL